VAFSVTPTSGAGPFTYTSEIDNKEAFESGYYRLEFAGSTATGNCTSNPVGGSLVPDAALSLLNTDTWVRTAFVAPGTCNTAVLRIIRNNDDTIMDYLFAYIDRTNE
jgi:hypothetical protein